MKNEVKPSASLFATRGHWPTGLHKGLEQTKNAVQEVLRKVNERPDKADLGFIKYGYQKELNKVYEKLFGPSFAQAFKDTFGVSSTYAVENTDHQGQVLMQFVLFTDVGIEQMKGEKLQSYKLDGSYTPAGDEDAFDFGFWVNNLTDRKVNAMNRIDIAYVHIKSAKTNSYVTSPEGRKIFSCIQKVWQLVNHDNTVHNHFFLNKRGSYLNPASDTQSWHDDSSWKFRHQYPPFLNNGYNNFYEVWAIHAHRDLLYAMYEKNPDLKRYVLLLGVKFMEQLKKVKDRDVRSDLLDLFTFAYGRIIDFTDKEFASPEIKLNYNIRLVDKKSDTKLLVNDDNLWILAQNMENSRIANKERFVRNWIHDPSHPKLMDLFEKGNAKIYRSHADVIKAYQY